MVRVQEITNEPLYMKRSICEEKENGVNGIL